MTNTPDLALADAVVLELDQLARAHYPELTNLLDRPAHVLTVMTLVRQKLAERQGHRPA